jgi:hypothetical protein
MPENEGTWWEITKKMAENSPCPFLVCMLSLDFCPKRNTGNIDH